MHNEDLRRNRGFTLFELIVVLVVMGLVSSLVVVSMAGTISRMHTQTAAKRIASSMRFARSQAVTEQTVYAASVDFENRRLSIARRDQQVERESEEVMESSNRPFEYGLPADVVFSKLDQGDLSHVEGVRELFFYPNGSTSGGSLWLEGEGERRYGVEVDLITGAVKIKEESET